LLPQSSQQDLLHPREGVIKQVLAIPQFCGHRLSGGNELFKPTLYPPIELCAAAIPVDDEQVSATGMWRTFKSFKRLYCLSNLGRSEQF